MMTHEAIPANRWLQGHRLVQTIDAISVWVGRAGAVLVAVLTAIVCYEVFSRYVLNSPHDWAFDASYMLFGTSFMLAGAYALAKSAHVRGDLIYAGLSARWLFVCHRLLGHWRRLALLAGWSAGLSVQGNDPDCRRGAAVAGSG